MNITTPADVTRTDGVKVCPERGRRWTVQQGADIIGVIWDEGETMSRGRFAIWAPFDPEAAFFHDAAQAIDAIVQAWPTTVADIAKETGAPVADILAAAEALAAEWKPDGRRAVLRIAAATGANTKVTREAAAVLVERLTPAAPAPEPEAVEKEPEHCMPYNGGKVHELITSFYDGSDGHPPFVFPLCRTGAMTNQGTRYRVVQLPLTCTNCVENARRRQMRAARPVAEAG